MNQFIKNSLIFYLIIVSVIELHPQNTSKTKALQNKKAAVLKEIQNLNSEISKTKKTQYLQLSSINLLSNKIVLREKLIRDIDEELNEVNNSINKKSIEIKKLQAEYNCLKLDYAKLIVATQKNQHILSKLIFLVSAESFNQAFLRAQYFQQITKYRKRQVKRLLETQSNLAYNLTELKVAQNKKELILNDEQQSKRVLTNEKKERESYVKALTIQEQKLKSDLEKKKRDSEKIQDQIKKLILYEIEQSKLAYEKNNKKQANKSSKAEKIKGTSTVKETTIDLHLTEKDQKISSDFAAHQNQLVWPLVNPSVVQEYGEYEHPEIKGFKQFNHGVDLAPKNNTKVYAVFKGVVSAITPSPTGDKLVIIRHGEYSSVYVNVSDVTISQGQNVDTNQKIGIIHYVNGKEQLNFQIWKGQKTLDPLQWLKR